jgi:methionyl aminopeptidase
MRQNGIIGANTLKKVREYAKPGISAYELDVIAEDYIKSKNAEPAFKGYRGFKNTLCVSVNEEIVHGIPDKKKILNSGDVVSLDVGVFRKGFYSDCAVTFVIGENSNSGINRLIEVTEKALKEAIAVVNAGCSVYDISFAIQAIAESSGFSVVREYTGHGIGRRLHEKPQILNYVPENVLRNKGYRLKNGNVVAIEPMINLGVCGTELMNDGWTVVTKDRKVSAHFEHTVAVYKNKPWVLTEI